MEWYYVREGDREGPVSESEFQSLVNSGTITSESLVWHKGMAQWQRYGELQTQTSAGEAGESHTCVECGRPFPEEEMVRYGDSWVCGKCKPVFFQRLKEGAPLRGVMVYGGFWIRAVAKIVDGIILSVINTGIQYGLGRAMTLEPGEPPSRLFFGLWALMVLAQMAVAVAYTTFFLGKFAATPGKMALGLRVVTSDGGRVSYLRAFARYFAELLSGFILGIGYLMAAFDEQKRTLHDRICDTRVIRK